MCIFVVVLVTCFAVSTLDVISSAKAIYEGTKPKKLAAQEILDCTEWNPKMDGGSSFLTYQHVCTDRGDSSRDGLPICGENWKVQTLDQGKKFFFCSAIKVRN